MATKYFYDRADPAQAGAFLPTEQEFIHAAADGTLTLDTTGRVLSSYKVHAGRTEFNTICSYDAAQALEHLITHADQLQVDVHKISTTGGSAGGGEIHYLTWVYHALNNNAARYTPVSMVYTMAQVRLPETCFLHRKNEIPHPKRFFPVEIAGLSRPEHGKISCSATSRFDCACRLANRKRDQ